MGYFSHNMSAETHFAELFFKYKKNFPNKSLGWSGLISQSSGLQVAFVQSYAASECVVATGCCRFWFTVQMIVKMGNIAWTCMK